MAEISSLHVLHYEVISWFVLVTNMATNDNSFKGMNSQLLCPSVETPEAAICNDDSVQCLVYT